MYLIVGIKAKTESYCYFIYSLLIWPTQQTNVPKKYPINKNYLAGFNDYDV